MALVRNVGDADRALRIIFGAGMAVAAVLIREHLLWAILLGLTGFFVLLEGAFAH